MARNGEPAVQLLGSAKAYLGERRLPFVPDKRYQLLAYLAYYADWVSRERLAFLFWPDSDSFHAKQNLRGLLKRVHGLEWLVGLEADTHQLRWSVETDTAAFRQAVEETRLEEALSLYRGPLLKGLETDEAPEFAHWLELEREQLQAKWRESLLKRAKVLRNAERYTEASHLLSRLLESDELDEEALRIYMQTCVCANKKEGALRAYQRFAKRLKEDLELEPTSATEQLKESIEAASDGLLPFVAPAFQPDSGTVSPAAPSALKASPPPTPATSFVGRDVEKAEIAHLLAEPDCRLLTLLGGGGVGKTRLAWQTALELTENYTNGTRFVALDSLSSHELLVGSLAASLGLQQDQENLMSKIVRHLERNHTLLVFDNFEHLLEGAGLLPELLQHCPDLNLLVTSRERLDLEEEWVLPVEGLAYPKQLVSLEQAFSYDAVQLFVQRAQRVLPRFDLSEDNLPHVLRLCSLVRGFPLGLELTAVWVRALPLAEIAQEVEKNLDFLSSDSRNIPERHRSVRAVFDHSWRLLSAGEQAALRKLAVFRGGFTREAATVVVGAPVAMLAALVDKSLLRVSGTGRFERHPLLLQYTQEKLAEQPEEQDFHRRHAGYFLALAQSAEPHLIHERQLVYLENLEAELGNLQAAFDWLLDKRETERALRLASSLGAFFFAKGHLQEGQAWLEKGLASAGRTETSTRAKAYRWAGYLTLFRGDYASANLLLEESRKLCYELGDIHGLASALTYLSYAAAYQEDSVLLKTMLLEATTVKSELSNPLTVADLNLALSFAAMLEGNVAKAVALHEESLALYREVSHLHGVIICLTNLGLLAVSLGEHVRARALFAESLELAQRSKASLGIHYGFLGLAGVATLLNQPRRAARLWGAAEALRDSTGLYLHSFVRTHSNYDGFLTAVRAQIDEAAFAAAWAEGKALTLEQALIYAAENPGRSDG